MPDHFTIVGIGEALFDIFPDDRRVGGAPLNTAVHAHQLGQACGVDGSGRQGRGVVVSRVGQDELGQELLEDLRQRGVCTDCIETDPDRATGRVYVHFDEHGEPRYEIVRGVAWDVLQFDPDLEDLARRCEAVCFGSLAQRDGQSRNTIYRFLDSCGRAIRLFDVNLRQDFYDQRIIRRSCERATIVKLNEKELPIVIDLLGIRVQVDAAVELFEDLAGTAILDEFGLDMVVLTRGERGTSLYTARGRADGEPANYAPADGADHVGAGDACSAAILVGAVMSLGRERVATLANHLGAYVASQPGAIPVFPDSILDMVKRS